MPADWINSLVASWEGLGTAPITTLRVVGVLLAAGVAVRLAHHSIRVAERRIAGRLTDRESAKRAGTLAQVSRYAVSVVLWVLAGIMVLSELGVSVAPILGAVGVVGIAVGFGAQSLVKDYFNGFFILVENQIRQGDVVRIGDHTGLVEEVTLRYVRLRDYEGNVHFVPNGMITSVVSMSRDFSYAVVDIGVGYREQVDEVVRVMKEVAASLQDDPDYAKRILAPLDVAGVDRWDNSAIVIRARMCVEPLEQHPVRREYLRRLKAAFDERGIEIPFPQMTLHRAKSRGPVTPPAPSKS